MTPRHPLYMYVIAVIVVLALVITLAWFLRGPGFAKVMAIFSSGFLMGMLAMYIAVHVYTWK